jgi:signal transduction histidine kinase
MAEAWSGAGQGASGAGSMFPDGAYLFRSTPRPRSDGAMAGVSRRERADDALRAGVYLGIGVLLIAVVPDLAGEWVRTGPPPPPPPAWQALLVLGLGCAGLLLRRARPLGCLLVVVVAVAVGEAWLGCTHIGLSLVFAEAVYGAVLYSSRRASAVLTAVAGVLVAGLALSSLAEYGTREAVLSLLGLSLLLIPVAWAREVRHHREVAAAAEERAEQTRRVAELDRAAAVAAERARMARDLHDVVAGQLSAIAIQSEAALTLPDAATQRRLLEAVRAGSVSALEEMRAMIGLLRAGDAIDAAPDARTAPTGLDALDALLDAGRASGLSIDVDDRRPPADALPAAVDLTAYRIVQESLTKRGQARPREHGLPAAGPHGRHPHRRTGQRRRVRPGARHRRHRHRVARPARAGRGRRRHRPRRRGARHLDRARRPARHRPRPGPGEGLVSDDAVRVVVADDQPAIRTGLGLILGSAPGIEVVAEPATGWSPWPRPPLRPDLVLMDIRMPAIDGIEATAASSATASATSSC